MHLQISFLIIRNCLFTLCIVFKMLFCLTDFFPKRIKKNKITFNYSISYIYTACDSPSDLPPPTPPKPSLSLFILDFYCVFSYYNLLIVSLSFNDYYCWDFNFYWRVCIYISNYLIC